MFYKMKSIIVLALAIAMVGTTIVTSYGVMQIEAVKSGTDILWCYSEAGLATPHCFPNHGDCTKAQQSDRDATSSCFKKKVDLF
jgi:hypothetical protein